MGLSSLTVAMFALLGTAVLFSAWSLTWGGAEVVSSPGNGPAARARELAASGVARWQAHAVAASSSSAAALRCNSQYVREAAEWEDFATAKPADSLINRQIRHVLERVSNNRSEVMIGIANDVMMCTNPKTCWWGGGNILASFVDVLRRLSVDNYIIIALDDQTGDFCKRAGAPYIRVDLEVPMRVNIYKNVRPRRRSPSLSVVQQQYTVILGPFSNTRMASSSPRRHLKLSPHPLTHSDFASCCALLSLPLIIIKLLI
ncbi:hypothetical protein T492DRAFT_282296 [Pavlovales sp. CCMP2436]|nr:hypothetical protein T492DRAFT_282296 [Pavlovales sp. CCMP2436]